MLESIFKNQALMTLLIASVWLIPGLVFTSSTNRKQKIRQKERQRKRISKLYPESK
ncbi:hypothetical protein [Prochlorococcus marinus]|uniref:hypothetical protein n=1 Tax=Prochlorococcus marinus TaxID=1219 RepID=UPI0022B55A4D|nr:hypothetical protein [Prochlorococcus marinus]